MHFSIYNVWQINWIFYGNVIYCEEFFNMLEIKIRKMRVSDMEAVMQIKNDEKWNQTEDDWTFLLKHNPEYCLVTIYKNQVIGTVTALNYQNKIAWIGMMLVSKNYRRLGVSKLLLNTVIEKLKDCASIKLDATRAGIPVYKKLGFIEEYEISRMILEKGVGIHQDAQAIEVTNLSQILESDIYNISELDEALFGVNRFNLFKFLFNNRNDICFQMIQDRLIKGYAFGRNGSNYVQIGPVMAYSTQIAKKLLYTIFKKAKRQPLIVDVLLDKYELKDWLLSIGFIHQRNFTRMHLKSNSYEGKKENLFLIGGPEMG